MAKCTLDSWRLKVVLALFFVIFAIIQLSQILFTMQFNQAGTFKTSNRKCIENESGEISKLKTRLQRMQSLLPVVHRITKSGKRHEESCHIETALLLLNQNKASESIFNDPFEDFTPMGGTDWSFRTTVPCSKISSKFRKNERRRQIVPSCRNNDVKLIEKDNFNQTFPSFGFPDYCLRKIIDKLCTTHFLVPNILHYIWLGKGSFDFMYFVSIYSGYKNQRPCLIFLYYDTLPTGEWWNLLLLYVANIIPVKVNPPSKIRGRNIIYIQHKADILRLRILAEYGGIYLDTDQMLFSSLDKFRNKECTMGMAADGYFGSALIVAVKNSAFIKKWMDSYSDYKPNLWGENSVIMATKIAKKNPNLIHVEKHYCSFYPHPASLFGMNYKWSHSYGLHIYRPGRQAQLKRLNFTSIRKLNNTLGAAFRFVLFDNKELCL